MNRNCPICRKPVDLQTSPDFPFCSERCRLMDLGNWSSEKYKIGGLVFDESELDDIARDSAAPPARRSSSEDES
jgi:hypothetical protein